MQQHLFNYITFSSLKTGYILVQITFFFAIKLKEKKRI